MIDRNDTRWYRNALIYQLHIKAFCDSDGDGIGDFAGLLKKLDYLHELGVTAIWLLPFYPSPMRDDGYDIADYRSINPGYGNMRDFRRFLSAAHERDLHVITELVINHTSDQHPWFQRARHAKPGSAYRDYYVWSDTDQSFSGTRIIFVDTEKSNWAWDPVAKAYYWHRFYSHQPDLNYDNPRVLKEVISVMRYWLDMGVDGLRLDAIPYLCQREGTNNENLPETHEVIRKLRHFIDENYPDRMLLAEANQWPEDTAEYFGRGDECHMAFHFPLMPRMYMALAREDRYPIIDILQQTPDIPDGCQWALFLRNHDELTLEMVTDEERDYLWRHYAHDRRMRINLGIRRRLSPLLEGDRRRIELLNGLLLSMPGTPIIYYGDEIGMGDNIYLGDRDGVRTPMQWSPDRNGGFSFADPSRLYLPPIMDPLYGYQVVNVEASQRTPSSLMNWMRRMLAVRKRHCAFGSGTIRFLDPGNRKILAYIREDPDETLLCIANLSRAAQAVELDLSSFKGCLPVELFHGQSFPPIGDLPYLFTLSDYAFYWFTLVEDYSHVPRWHEELPEPMLAFATLVMRDSWRDLLAGQNLAVLEGNILKNYLPKQRWFSAKDSVSQHYPLVLWGALEKTPQEAMMLLLVSSSEQEVDFHFLPLSISWGETLIQPTSPLLPFALAKVRKGPHIGVLHDALAGDRFGLGVLDAMLRGKKLKVGDRGFIHFTSTHYLHELDWSQSIAIKRLMVEQSNSSMLLDDKAILKIYRHPALGENPEVEMALFLTEMVPFANIPPILGIMEYQDEHKTITLGLMSRYIENQGDGWSYVVDNLERDMELLHMMHPAEIETPDEEEVYASLVADMRLLGERTGQMHQALAGAPQDLPGFAPEPVTSEDIQSWKEDIHAQINDTAAVVQNDKHWPDKLKISGEQFIRNIPIMHDRIDALLASGAPGWLKTRVHGDYHLGQVLIAHDDFYVVDFEGEPASSMQKRRQKHIPLKDVAGMLRSFDYAGATVLHQLREQISGSEETLASRIRHWGMLASSAFISGYQSAAGFRLDAGQIAVFNNLLSAFLLEKALYEVRYEAANRPDWLFLPLEGLRRLLSEGTSYDLHAM